MVPFCIASDSESGKNAVLIVLTYNLGTYALLFLNVYTVRSIEIQARKTGLLRLMIKEVCLDQKI
ncbi:hypothetical protein I314_03067 [Cryptococcus bacillisporus CA1873]|uniref:Uncharacterized protein n=1 Tax=Cryptococcus bacillisporus CA1873 TaxID=1296111 RepID=A0ABR5BBI0_CRYGA|nr:hypothetical protein I314_03067 [Cryptococcus bacillisporus CA1873]|eukprot:KIR63662.1 hypothetical protein I314_03067 [Cryptococcus gattii CA1873]